MILPLKRRFKSETDSEGQGDGEMVTRQYELKWRLGLMICMALTTSVVGRVIYVDDDAIGKNDGSSWENAYPCLQDALKRATDGDEILVAQGVYRPDQEAIQTETGIEVVSSGDRKATFQLIDGVTLKGGYAGIGESDPNVHDINWYATVLSGDLKGDDVPVFDPRDLLDEPSRADNTFHVVTGSGTDETAVLDGFTITGGHAHNSDGGGVYNDNGHPLIRNCTLFANTAMRGGAMCNNNGHPLLANWTFEKNAASKDGGAIFNLNSYPSVNNSVFIGNLAQGSGGAICNRKHTGVLRSTGFVSVQNDQESRDDSIIIKSGTRDASYRIKQLELTKMSLVNCIINGNSAANNGGGLFNHLDVILENCLLSGNAANAGGATYNHRPDGYMTMVNCTVTTNRADGVAGGVFGGGLDHASVTNCIVWYNSAGSWSSHLAQCFLDRNPNGELAQVSDAAVNYSCIQNWTGALGGEGIRKGEMT